VSDDTFIDADSQADAGASTVPPSAGAASQPSTQPDEPGAAKRALSGTRELMRIAYRDPGHIPERLTLHAIHTLAEPSREWAENAVRERPDETPAQIADGLRDKSAKIARLDGAIAGTPFFVALVPGYLSYLRQEARMGLRTAALFGRDPSTIQTAAELLALRGVHPSVDEATSALREIADTPPPVKQRRSWRTWVNSLRYVLIFGGFLDPPSTKERPSGARDRLRAAIGITVAAVIWVATWVLPVSFMIAMAWGCESHSRQLGLRTLAFYGGEGATTDGAIAKAEARNKEGRTARQMLRALALGLSVGIPIFFVAYANHVSKDTGINGLVAVGALVALSLVAAGAVWARRS
jgi:hypothetical protein